MADGLYIGLISGTSQDGIDSALVEFAAGRAMLRAARAHPWPTALVEPLRDLARDPASALRRFGELDALAGEAFGDAVLALLDAAGVAPHQVRAIGSHGQTVLHAPRAATPYTLQIADPNRIAQRTGITTVADFRRRDMAAGGEGAPLVPAFHRAQLARTGEDRAVLNIGGIANLTLLPGDPAAPVGGFDTGPGNCLLDLWAQRHLGQRYDAGGAWAARGKVRGDLLQDLLADPYFARGAPKSTGPEYFSAAWLAQHLGEREDAPEDVQATLLALTGDSVVTALRKAAPATTRLLVCGGGVHNSVLMQHLAQRLAPLVVESTASHGLDPDWVEAAAFAWLARETLAGRPGNLPAVTGARAPVVLGGIYPGGGQW